MSRIGLLSLVTGIGAVGVFLAVSGLMQPAPSLDRVLRRLHRAPDREQVVHRRGIGRLSIAVFDIIPRLLLTKPQLQRIGRNEEQHAVFLLVAGLGGVVVPSLLAFVLGVAGMGVTGWVASGAAAVGCGVLAVVVVHRRAVDRAEEVRNDLRHQVSAFLDVVSMLLAGNTGYEGALEQAAHAGDGRLFVELQRAMREAGTRGRSLTSALEVTGSELGLTELEQVAATAALSAAEGAPVSRTLAAKCATLRLALSTEQESEARLRTSRLTTPIVGMALIFMALVIYPALTFS